jgi:hypothetical protein
MARRVLPVCPNQEELTRARSLYVAYEPRDLFYRAATELVRLAFKNKSSLTVSEALAVLLQTWNSQYYRWRGGFGSKDFEAIDEAVKDTQTEILSFRTRCISTLKEEERNAVARTFTKFDLALGPVGAAKALHLLAPDFFPLWDREIAYAYTINLDRAGLNASEYFRFMMVTRAMVVQLDSSNESVGILKRIDEYNYCRFTKNWFVTNKDLKPSRS